MALGSIPGRGTKIQQDMQYCQKKNHKNSKQITGFKPRYFCCQGSSLITETLYLEFKLLENHLCSSNVFQKFCTQWTQVVLKFVVQSLNWVRLFDTSWTAVHQASLSFTISHSLLKLISIESVMPSTILSSLVTFFSCLPSFPASGFFLMSRLFVSGSQSIGAFWATSSKMREESYVTEFSQMIYTVPGNIPQF